MSDSVQVSQVKPCDVCRFEEKMDHPRPAEYDSKTHWGQWANVCKTHWFSHTNQALGTGFGQRLVYPEGALAQFNAEREVALQLGGRVI